MITAVNGVAAGAGFSLAIAGDLVLAADSRVVHDGLYQGRAEPRRQLVVPPAPSWSAFAEPRS